jgi:hypothetical protein
MVVWAEWFAAIAATVEGLQRSLAADSAGNDYFYAGW